MEEAADAGEAEGWGQEAGGEGAQGTGEGGAPEAAATPEQAAAQRAKRGRPHSGNQRLKREFRARKSLAGAHAPPSSVKSTCLTAHCSLPSANGAGCGGAMHA